MSKFEEKPRDQWTDREFIVMFGREAKEQGSPVFLGELQRHGWTAPIPTYLVWCRECQFLESKGYSVVHEAGYTRRLECATCQARFDDPRPVARLRTVHPLLTAALVLAFIAALIAVAAR